MKKFSVLLAVVLLFGCKSSGFTDKKASFTLAPFTALSDVEWCGEEYTAAVSYSKEGALAISLDGGALENPVVFSISEGRQIIEQGDLSFSQSIEEALPSSIAVQFYTGMTTLSACEETKADENGDYCFYGPMASAVSDQDGNWKQLNLENGCFVFKEFTFTSK